MKLFVFYYTNDCDFSETVLVQAETEEQARMMKWVEEFDSYTKEAIASPASRLDPYHIPTLTWPEYCKKYKTPLMRYKMTHVFDILPNSNPKTASDSAIRQDILSLISFLAALKSQSPTTPS